MLAPVLLNKEPQQQAYNRGMALLKRVGLADRAFNYPDELSGGQQQRAAIVRALAMNPGAILFDEPTSALDPMMTGEVTAVIKELAENGLTMMIVTHEMDFARDVSTRVFYMDGGGICEQGSPETLFDNPENERTMAFVRKIRLFTRNIESDSFDYLGLRQNIIAFCMEMFVSRHMTYSLVHCLEECVMHGLLKDSGVEYPVSLSVGYGQDSGLVLTLSYRGGNADIRKTMDEISLKMINQYSCGIEISSNGSENRAVMRIKD